MFKPEKIKESVKYVFINSEDDKKIVKSASLGISISCFAIAGYVKVARVMNDIVIPRIVLPTLLLEDVVLILGIVTLVPWLALKLYERDRNKSKTGGKNNGQSVNDENPQ